MAKRGRKPKGEFEGRTAVYSARLTPETKAALEEAAARSGRSVSQEVEMRLRQSLESEMAIQQNFGGPDEYAVAQLVAKTLQITGHVAVARCQRTEGASKEPHWLHNPDAFGDCRVAVNAVLDAIDPGKPPPPERMIPLWGEMAAATVTDAAADPEAMKHVPGLYHWAKALQSRLGVSVTPQPPHRRRLAVKASNKEQKS